MTSPPTIVYKIKELDTDIIAPSTKRMYEKDQGGSKIVCIGKPGCLQAGSKILMYNGNIKNVEDIKIGDQLMGDDSTPRNVLELCRGRDQMYEIIPKKGDTWVVNTDHILTLKCIGKKDIIDISVRDFLQQPKSFQESYEWFHTDVNFDEQECEFDPYLLGMWLKEPQNIQDIPPKTKGKINFLDFLKTNGLINIYLKIIL